MPKNNVDDADEPTTTPITDMVRDQKGDYLAVVESLEESHAKLLEAVENILPHLQDDLNAHEPWIKEIEALELATAKARKV